MRSVELIQRVFHLQLFDGALLLCLYLGVYVWERSISPVGLLRFVYVLLFGSRFCSMLRFLVCWSLAIHSVFAGCL